ncbi:serine/threonine protein kinase, partial [Klebsiella oxytoca]
GELRYALAHYTDLEVQAQRKYRGRLRAFGIMMMLSLICAVGGEGFLAAADRKQGSEYQQLMHMAEMASDTQEACRLYLD